MQRARRDALVGAGTGVAATTLMSVYRALAQRFGLMGQLPPRKVTGRVLAPLGLSRRDETQDAMTVAAHWGFGTTLGVVFALVYRRVRLPLPAALQGIVFATLVWAISYQGWIPALGLLPPPRRDRPGQPAVMLLAHWLYGLALGTIVERGR